MENARGSVRNKMEGVTGNMRCHKKLPVGIDNFEKIRKNNFYYVDKTGLIRDLLERWAEVNLITRPRRFGKTLNMSMLKCFFEIGSDKMLFDNLEITEEQELCEAYMGKYPVIFLSLKGVIGETFPVARSMMCAEIKREAMRFQNLLESNHLTQFDKKMMIQLLNDEMDDAVLMNSLRMLSTLLQKHYEQNVILLIDEYDVPLDKAYEFGFYNKMVELIRNLFGQVLKGNDSLYFAVLTGCLRISKESIFTGLNNFKILSITDVRFDEYFGFTNQEVKRMLSYYQLDDHYMTLKEWYKGYHFGEAEVYCPWDVTSYCDALCENPLLEPQAYWMNTSSNSIVKKFIQKAGKATQREIESLIEGKTIPKRIRQDLTYNELDTSIENLWSVLFTTGYLTQRQKINRDQYELEIPNLEIREIFVNQIQEWFQETASKDKGRVSKFCNSFKEGKEKEIEIEFNSYLMKTISIRDTFVKKTRKENFYHGLLLGLLSHEEEWIITSNAETGEGYSDILIEIEEENIGIIIEVKYAENGKFDNACKAAIEQIHQLHYVEKLKAEQIEKIFVYGIACYKKHCKVVKQQL